MAALIILCPQGMYVDRTLSIIPKINRLKERFSHVFYIVPSLPESQPEIHKFFKINKHDIIIKSQQAFHDDEGETILNHMLHDHKIRNLFFCGVNEEDNIYLSVISAYKYRYVCYMVYDVCVGQDDHKIARSREFLKKIGVKFVLSDDIGLPNKH